MTPEVIENAEIKKCLPNTKILLDNTYKCDTLGVVEKCVPIYSGRFAFWGCSRPSLEPPTTILSALVKACATKTFAPHPGIPASVRSRATFAVPAVKKEPRCRVDRKSTRLNSSHSQISYAVFCLKKKKNKHLRYQITNKNKIKET